MISPFLLGTTILFWGWQTGFWIVAIPLALIYEGSRYINWRWQLATSDFRTTSHVCTVLLVAVLIYLLVSDRSLQLIFSFFQWLPVICAPLLIALAYSTSDRIDIQALLFFDDKSNTARSWGFPPEATVSRSDRQQFFLDLAYPYFAICILAASAANNRDWSFYACAIALISGVLISTRSKRFSTWLFLLLLLLATGLGTVGHIKLHQAQMEFQRKTYRYFYRFYRPQRNPDRVSTSIGDIGTLKQSNKILLRLKSEPQRTAPELIRRATYNRYVSGFWGAARAEFAPVTEEDNSWILQPEASLNSRNITVTESTDDGQILLKHPDGSGIAQLPAEKVERNQYGTLQAVVEPGLLSYQIYYDPEQSWDSPPTKEDLNILDVEQPAIAQIANQLDLRDREPSEVLNIIKRFFNTEFTYTLELTRKRRQTPLATFLLNTRSGHCEYFATATALLLREVGIPTRYAVGYSVHEFSRLERQYIVRQRHAHAWTQVYIDGKWQSFDTTPPSWIAIENNAASNWQYVRDFSSFISFKLATAIASIKNASRLQYLWLLALPLAFILFKFARQRRKKQLTAIKIEQQTTIAVGADSEIYLIERELNKLGCPRDRAETWQHWLQRLQNDLDNLAILGELNLIIQMHYRYCFDPQSISDRQREQLRAACQAWLEQYKLQQNNNK